MSGPAFRITLLGDGTDFECRAGEPVLEAARRAGLELPHACRGGRCGLCAARVVTGRAAYPDGAPPAAELHALAPGEFLLCRAEALSDLTLDLAPVRTAGAARVKRLPARVARVETLNAGLAKVWLKLPRAESFVFRAGQYLDVLLGDGERRSYSIASPPHDDEFLELHLRRPRAGGLAAAFYDRLAPGVLLEIEGPRGRFRYSPSDAGRHLRPLVLVAGGTGFAPMKSILRHVLDGGSSRALVLYWGARRREELYDHGWLTECASRHPTLRYVPVVSDEPAATGVRTGLVHEAVTADLPESPDVDVYAAGPPPMLDALRIALAARGLAPEHFHADLP